MKKITLWTFLMFGIFGYAQNQSNGSVSSTISPASGIVTGSNVERFRFGSGLVTQLDTGTDFDFTASSQWLSFGKLTTPSQTLYGYRAQRAGRGLIFGFTGPIQSSNPTLGTSVIEWVGNGTATAGDLLFRTSPSSTSATSTQVMKMRENASSVFGNTSVYEDGDFVANYLPNFQVFSGPSAATLIPKVEVNFNDNSISSGLSVFRKGNYPTPGAPLNTPRVYGASIFNQNLNPSISQGAGTRVYGLTAQARNTGGNSFGIEGIAIVTDSANPNTQAIGVSGQGFGAPLNYGVQASSGIEGQEIGRLSYGVQATSQTIFSLTTTATSSYGVWASSTGNSRTGSLSYGVYGSATGANNFAGYFNGRIFSTNALVVSDKTLKEDVKNEENALEKLSQLQSVTYKFINDSKKTGLNLSDKLQHGFIAQELEKVYPELVEEILNPIFNEKGEQIGVQKLKAVNYVGLISVLTSSVNEMSKKLVALEERLNENKSTYIVNPSARLNNDILLNIEKNSYSLEQNVPNPFTDKTVINYTLPENEKNAKIFLLNLSGQLIKEYPLKETKGQLIIEAGLLQKGIYLYSLISNNQEIISKKMIVN